MTKLLKLEGSNNIAPSSSKMNLQDIKIVTCNVNGLLHHKDVLWMDLDNQNIGISLIKKKTAKKVV